MLKWTTVNKTYCCSQLIWNKQLNIKNDLTKTLGKSRFLNWQLDWLHADKTNLIDRKWEEKEEGVSNDHVQDRSWYLRTLRTRHIHTHLFDDLDTSPIVVSHFIYIRISCNNNNNNNIQWSDIISRQSIWTVVHINIEMTAL